jgi:hypothetical protein
MPAAGSDITICSGQTGFIGNPPLPFYTYVWSPVTGLGNSFASATDVTLTNTSGSSVDYTYILTNTLFSCSSVDSMIVTVDPAPNVNAGPDTVICNGSSVTLSGSGATDVVWTPSATLSNDTILDPVATPTTPTFYYLTSTGSNACSHTDTVFVNVEDPLMIVASADVTVCIGLSDTLSVTGGTTYDWSPGTFLDDSTGSDPIITPLSSQTYTVSSTNACGTFADEVQVTISSVTAFAGNDTIIYIGDSASLNATGGTSCYWNFSLTLSATDVCDPYAFPADSGRYIVTVVNEDGCIDKDTVWVFTVLNTTGVGEINTEIVVKVVPNPFSETATITIHGSTPGELLTMEVFDMLSRQVAEIALYNGETKFSRGQIPAGIYFYRISGVSGIRSSGKLMIE